MGKSRIPRITSDFALLDVKSGRNQLLALVGEHKHRVPIALSGYIVGDWSGDDGTSIEFEIEVTALNTGVPQPHSCTCIRCKPKPTVIPTSGKLACKSKTATLKSPL